MNKIKFTPPLFAYAFLLCALMKNILFLFRKIRIRPFIGKSTLVAVLVLSVIHQVRAQVNTTAIDIKEFSFTPSTIDTTSSSQPVTVTIHVTFTEMDVTDIVVYFQSPKGGLLWVQLYSVDRISGNGRDGVYQKAIIFPQYSNSGIWKIQYISVYNIVNRVTKGARGFYESTLMASGFNTKLQVINNNDEIAPEIIDFSLTPSSFNTATGSQDVTITVHARDAAPGVRSIYVNFFLRPEDAYDSCYWGFCIAFNNANRISGDDKDGVYRITYTFSQYTASGIYGVYVGVSDALGNSIDLDPAELASRGFSSQLGVNTPVPTHTRTTPFDFDGDGKSDISVFRPSNGAWYLNQSTNGFSATQFGLSTDKIAPADYDGDGKTDIAVFRDGFWYLQRSALGFTAIQFGQAGDVPVPVDYDGDGKADIAVFRSGVWYIRQSSNNQFQGVQFGLASDKPVAADYDGDGKADIAVVRQASGISTWYILGTSRGFYGLQFGTDTDKIVPADYDGDGKTDPAVYRDGTWYLLQSSQGFTAFQFGISSDIPVPADYDGDGKADAAVYRGGTWYLQQSTNGFAAQQFGLINDKPAPAAFLP